MARYLDMVTDTPETIHFDFATRADFSERKEYFSDFVLGGGRDLKAYGLTRITPTLTMTYDVNGLNFLKFVLGHSDYTRDTVNPSTLTPKGTIGTLDVRVTVESENMSIHNGKVNTWEITVEEGNPVRAEVNIIGKSIGTEAANTYNPDFSDMPLMPYEVTISTGGSELDFTRFNIRISNALQAIFKTSSIPVEIREAGLDVTGRIRANNFSNWATEGPWTISFGTIGTIILHQVKFMEIPPRVTGFDLPETEINWTAYPTASTCAITAKIPANPKW